MTRPNQDRVKKAKAVVLSDHSFVDRVRKVLRYNKRTGIVSWRISSNHFIEPGDRAGYYMVNGHRLIGLEGHRFLETHIIWLIVTGQWPEHEIDHRNRKQGDNRWCNLREATRQQNVLNQAGWKHKPSGLPRGVYRKRDKFRVHITIEGRTKSLGTFSTVEEATSFRLAAERKYYGAFAP